MTGADSHERHDGLTQSGTAPALSGLADRITEELSLIEMATARGESPIDRHSSSSAACLLQPASFLSIRHARMSSEPSSQPQGVQPHDALPPMPPQAIPPPSAPDLSALLRGALPPQPGLPPHGNRHPVVKSARPTSEQVDERCWTFTKQTNAKR